MPELYDFLEAEAEPVVPPITLSQTQFMEVLDRVDKQANLARLKFT